MLEIIYSFFCHQQPSRSLVIASQFLPLCARCTGIYLGFLISLICLITMVRKDRSMGFWPVGLSVSGGILTAFILSAAAENLGWLEVSNKMRFLLALFAGCSIAYIFVIISKRRYNYLDDKVKGFGLFKALAMILLLLIAGFMGIRFDMLLMMYRVLPLFGIIILYIMLNINVSRLIFGVKKRKYLIGSVLLLLAAELFILKILHS